MIDFGKHTREEVLDEHGSTKKTVTNFKNYDVLGEIREYYEIRKPVFNDLEEMAQFSKFYNEYTADESMCDPGFRVEGRSHSKKTKYAVKSYYKVIK